MVPFERALVTSYRPSMVTFTLSLRVSDILSLLCSSTPLFPTPPRLLKISPCSPGSRWMALGPMKSECVGLIVRAISFQDFQPMWSWSTNVADGRTNRRKGRHRRHAITIPRFALHSIARRTVAYLEATSDILSGSEWVNYLFIP